jgi:hypothetical protein
MTNDFSQHGAPTRRDYVKYSGTIAVGGFLAGCTGDGGSDLEPESTPEDGETETSDEPTETERSYSISMEPVGDVTFESVPEEFDETVVRQKARERAAEQQNWQIHKDEVERRTERAYRRLLDHVPDELSCERAGELNTGHGSSEESD